MKFIRNILVLLAGAVPASRLPAAPGDVDMSFNPNASGEPTDGVHSVSMEPDGRIFSGGSFDFVGGFSHPNVVRLTAGGVVDATFNTVANDVVQANVIQPDGKIVFGGVFTNVNGNLCTRMARLHAEGALDTSFSASANNEVRTITLLPDGSLYAGGQFTTFNGEARPYLVKLDAEGSLDAVVAPVLNNVVRVTALQTDGKLVIGGQFSSVNGVARNRMARLNADGTVDMTFNPNVTGAGVYCLAVQADGAVVMGGVFTAVGGSSRANLARVTSSGALDPGFNLSANGVVRCVALQTDGRAVLTGEFTSVGSMTRNRIARLNASGTLDTGFNPGANDVTFGATIQQDGKVIAVGEFTTVGGAQRGGFVRLENDAASQSLTIQDLSRIQWLRGGTSPESSRVTFELSTNGGSGWTLLPGAAVRIAGGWQLAGLTLPATGQVRARAIITGGYANGSSGLVETVTAYSFSPLQAWRFTNFGTLNSTGNAADNEDPDRDGLENLVEFAFGRNPNTPDAAALPVWQREDDDLVLAFTPPAAVSGITYHAESSPDLTPGSWTPVTNAGTAPAYTFYALATDQRIYLRVRVTAP